MLAAIARLPLIVHLTAAGVSFGLFQWVKARLDTSYAASGHPVDYATGQLAFDAETIEGYYAHMQAAGTLDIYWQTQMIDFGFIASIAALSLFLGTLAARLGGRINAIGRRGFRLGLTATFFGLAGAGFDALENLISFIMLSRPDAIAQPLALAYSSAAAAKFAALTAGMAAVAVSVLLGVVARVRRMAAG